MLVLSRKKNESIVINGDIEVMVIEIRGADGRAPVVRLGVKAPRNVAVDRKEIHASKRAEAAQKAGSDEPGTTGGESAGAISGETPGHV